MSEEAFNVLLIEDNPGDARLIQELLAEPGGAVFTLDCVDRLSTGLKRLAEGGIDVILLDLGLPDSQGLDTFARTYEQTRDVPIVVLTGLDDETLATQATTINKFEGGTTNTILTWHVLLLLGFGFTFVAILSFKLYGPNKKFDEEKSESMS